MSFKPTSKPESKYTSLTDISQNIQKSPSMQQTNSNHRMDVLLREAKRCLEEFLLPTFLELTKSSLQVLQEGKAVLFATVLQHGHLGAGVLLRRLGDKWSPPCAVLIENPKLDLSSQFRHTNHILVWKDERCLNDFVTTSEIILKDDNSVSALSIGKEYNVNVEVDPDGFEKIRTVSTVKGTNVEHSLNGLKIRVDYEWNTDFYQQPVIVKDIFAGTVQMPFNQEYNGLCEALKRCISYINIQQNTKYIPNVNQSSQLSNVNDNNKNYATSNLKVPDNVVTNRKMDEEMDYTTNIQRLYKSGSDFGIQSHPGRNFDSSSTSSDKTDDSVVSQCGSDFDAHISHLSTIDSSVGNNNNTINKNDIDENK